MATDNGRTAEQVRRDIEAERERLAAAVDDLRAGIDVNASAEGQAACGRGRRPSAWASSPPAGSGRPCAC